MANKRQRKKQQAKKNIQQLKRVGVSDKRVINELKNKPTETRKIVKKAERNIEADRRSQLIRQLGYKVSDHSSKRWWSAKRWDEWYSTELAKKEKARKALERKQRRKKQDDDDLYLLIFWKEKTDAYKDSQELIDQFKNEYKYVSVDYLIEAIRAFSGGQRLPAEIGTTAMVVVKGSQRTNTINFYKGFDDGTLSSWNEWGLVYEGKAVRYKELVLAVHTVIRLLYDNSEKADFMSDLFKNLSVVNKKNAARLARDLKWRGF